MLAAFLSAVWATSAGCDLGAIHGDGSGLAEGDDVGSTTAAVIADNRLVYNRLVYNRLVYNRLVYNRLVYNRLDSHRLALRSDAAHPIEATAEGRELLVYIARCALAEGDILVAIHDGQSYEFAGELGLAREWEWRGLSASKQQVMSACLLAHVNATGTSVQISLRSGCAIDTTSAERADYPVHEATFFGQVFGTGPLKTYACRGDSEPIALAHSTDRALRVCSDDNSPCGITSMGRCQDVCEEREFQRGWTKCWAGGVRYDDTISTYLWADDLDGQNQVCGPGHNCSLSSAPGTRAILDCTRTHNCNLTCAGGGTCTLDGGHAHNVRAFVRRDAVAEVSCLDAHNCNMMCEDASCELSCVDGHNCRADCQPGSDCRIDCRDAYNCHKIYCQPGARCLLTCEDASHCGYAQCQSGAVTCLDGSIACGRPCP